MERPMQKLNDLSRSLTALEPDGTLIAVVESTLLKLLYRWREEAEKAGRRIERIAVAFEAGRDGFWLARWLKACGIEAYVIHASSIAVSREHRRASQKPSRPASKATAIRSILRPAFSASSRHRYSS